MRPYPLRVHTQRPAATPQPFDLCIREFDRAAEVLDEMDPQITSIGITQIADGHGYRVLRRRRPGVRALRELDAKRPPVVRGVPLVVVEAHADLRPLVELAISSFGASASRTMVHEQDLQRPLCAGLQLQNWDCDQRLGRIASGHVEVGSLGLFVRAREHAYLVSNNHVLAGQNHGQIGDRILQCGGPTLSQDQVVARLERFVPLEVSPTHAHPRLGNVRYNRVDAAMATLAAGIGWAPGYLAHHQLPTIGRRATPTLGETVFKVGRTSGLRRGRIVSTRDRVGPVPYAIGNCWFRGSFTVESVDGRPFSEPGDSGAAVVRQNGEVLGLVYAGNGVQTFACPITDVIEALGLD